MTEHVKVYGIKPRIQYSADGTLTTYEFPFAIFTASDLDVYFGDTLQDSDTYSVSGIGNSEGGSITFGTAPSADTIITITRNLSIERTSDFQEGATLRAKVLNDELDYQVACQQQLADTLNRSMVLPPYAADNDLDLSLPAPSAGKAIVWNADGTKLENSIVAVNAMESTLNGYKTAAETAATTATDKASVATTQAQTATTQAGIATTKASEITGIANQLGALRTNCLTAIPQDIRLELNNGTLTLKSGSVITFPDGSQYQTTADRTLTFTTDGQWYVVATNAGVMSVCTYPGTSGTADPVSPSTKDLFFDTSDLKCKRWNGTTWENESFPLCIITATSGAISSIDKVFNGAGYVGKHAFVLPGVGGLAPMGFNPDGTVNGLALMTNSLSIAEMSTQSGRVIGFQGSANISSFPYGEADTIAELQQQYRHQYCQETNTTWLWQNNAWTQDTRRLPMVFYEYNGTSVTKFDIRRPVRLATTEMLDKSLSGKADTNLSNLSNIGKEVVLTLGEPDYSAGVSVANNTDYTCPSAGFIISTVNCASNSDSVAYLNGTEFMRLPSYSNSVSHGQFNFPVAKGNIVKINSTHSSELGVITFYPLKGA